MKFTHPTDTQYLTYEELREEQYKDYFEFCVTETGMRFDYPKDRDKIGDLVVDGDEMILALNTKNNIEILKKIRDNIGVSGCIILGIDNVGCIVYTNLRSVNVKFDRNPRGVGSDCLVPSIE